MRYWTQILLCIALTGGCATAPNNLISQGSPTVAAVPTQAQSSILQAVASADIGVPTLYVEPDTGNTVELVVRSEYFSANGRNCRRFSQLTGGEKRNGVSCQDSRQGWIELPLASYLR